MAVQVKRRGSDRKRTKKATSAWLDDSNVRGWGNEVFALILFAVTLFLAATVSASLATRLFEGTWIADSLRDVPARLGPLGSMLGEGLSHLLGWCSIVPVVWLGWFSWFTWNLDEKAEGFSFKDRLLPFGGAVLLLVFSCTLSSVLFSSESGGILGLTLGVPTEKLLGGGGAMILHVVLFVAALSLATRKSIGVLLASMWDVTKKFVAITLIIAPVYFARLLVEIFRGTLTAVRFGGTVATKGWGAAFSAPHKEEPIPEIPKPRRKKKEAPVDDETFDLGIPKSSRNVEKIIEEPIDLSEEEDDEPEQYSHVVVQRRTVQPVSSMKEREPKSSSKKKLVDEDAEPMQGDFSGYRSPSFEILTKGEISDTGEDDDELLQKSRQIEAKLRDFNIQGRVTEVHPGPVITLFEFEPAPGVKVGKIAALQDDLAMSLRATSIRIIAPIPKKGTVGIEIPNKNRDMVRLRDVLDHPEFVENKSILTVPLGKDTYGDPVYVDIAMMPHLLMAGATGTGKSVCINALLVSLLYKASPAELGLILIDPKILELSIYEGIPHLKVPVVTVPKQAKAVLDWAAKEMDRRYRMMQKYGVRNIDGYNRIVAGEKEETSKPEQKLSDFIELSEAEVLENGTIVPDENIEPVAEKVLIAEEMKPLPKIVIVIDELADLMLTVGRDIEELITRLAQKARAAGIHLIIATQRPSVDVITGLIKANFPARLSFRVTSRIDSRTILDSMGAERLLGRGDMLFMQPGGTHLRRIHGAFVSDNEVQKVIDAVKKSATPCYDQKILDMCEKALKEDAEGPEGSGEEFAEDAYDPLYDKAVELVVSKGQASTSMVQRVFRIGYNRAARIIEMMEKEGVIGPMDGIKPREVLVQGVEEQE